MGDMAQTDCPTVVDAICKLALALKAPVLKDRLWIHKADENWTIAANGMDVPMDAEPEGCMKCTLLPIDFAVWWHGWLVGTFNPLGGIFAAGSEANEDRFIADMAKAADRAKE